MGAEQSHECDVGEDVWPETLNERSVQGVAQHIKDAATNIVVLTGAGISTSAGIPDFRSPETGLYANLERLHLPYAEAVFDISYFRKNPEPFYLLARELYPGKYIPTISHAFIALLSQKGKLRMLFTQNIDCLERSAGISPGLIVEAHGSFATQRCIDCKTEYPKVLMMEAIENSKVPRCSDNPDTEKPDAECNGLVKPDIVFFGEQLPAAFHSNLHVPRAADLMLIIGTSLTVHPFASLPGYAGAGVPRVLFNMERVGGIGSRADDVCVLGPCDEGIRELADALGWTAELEELWVGMGGGKDKTPREVSTVLEDKIDQLTKDVEKATLNSSPWLEKHLAEKQQKGPGALLSETTLEIESTLKIESTTKVEPTAKVEYIPADLAESSNATSSSLSSSDSTRDVAPQGSERKKKLLQELAQLTSSNTTSKATPQYPLSNITDIPDADGGEGTIQDPFVSNHEDTNHLKSSL